VKYRKANQPYPSQVKAQLFSSPFQWKAGRHWNTLRPSTVLQRMGQSLTDSHRLIENIMTGRSLTAPKPEIKKGRYVYYHCTGFKGRCPEPYTREEVLEEKFTGILKGISFSDEVLGWVRQALRESDRDERQFHDDAITKLQREHQRLQGWIDAMYDDKLDGRIAIDYFDIKAAEMRAAQTAIMRDLAAHQTANCNYIEEGVQLLELAHLAPVLFESQPPMEKRKLLNFVLSNWTWKAGELPKYRQPFDVLAVAVASEQQQIGWEVAEKANFENWLLRYDSNYNFRLTADRS
jgi:hypothetical protein